MTLSQQQWGCGESSLSGSGLCALPCSQRRSRKRGTLVTHTVQLFLACLVAEGRLCEPGIILSLFRTLDFLCPPFFGLLFLSSAPIQSTQKIPEHLRARKENCLESALQKTLAVRRKHEVMIGVMAKWNISSTFKEAPFFPQHNAVMSSQCSGL